MPAPVKEEVVYGEETWYREVGYYITSRKEQFDRSCKYFDIAVNKAPDNKRALLGRSIARAKTVQYDGALADIKKAIALDPDCLLSQSLKSWYTYLNCDYEEALMTYLRVAPFRMRPDNARLGVRHCQDAIENCIGARAGHPLRDHVQIIRNLEWKKAKEKSCLVYKPQRKRKANKKTTPHHMELIYLQKRHQNSQLESNSNLKIYPSLHSHKHSLNNIPQDLSIPYRPLQEYTINIDNYMASKYLELMHPDKKCLKEIKRNKALVNCNERSSKKMIHIIKGGYKVLCYKQELLRHRRPFYFIKYQELNLLSATLWAKQMRETAHIRKLVQTDARLLLAKIETCIHNKHTRMALETAEKLKLLCEARQKKHFPNKADYLKKTYKLVAMAHLELKKLNPNSKDPNRRIFNMLGYPVPKNVSKDSILQQDEVIDWKKQIAIAEKRLIKAKDSDELAWLYYDLSRYNTEVKNYEVARIYARKCISEAEACNENSWVINAILLIVRINMQCRNKVDAKQELQKALQVADTMHNSCLEDYLKRTMDVIESFQFVNTNSKEIKKREEEIINVISTFEQKSELQHMFRLMAALPCERRMPIMPGVKVENSDNTNLKINRNVEDATSMHFLPQSKRHSGGKSFLHLMQFHLD